MWAILGGTGFKKFDNFKVIDEMTVETPFGHPSAPIQKVRIGNIDALFLKRHGNAHEFLPSHINYLANIFALKKCGANSILSVSAVGSLQPEIKPGDCVIPSQYINHTKSRLATFCRPGVGNHVSLAHPVDKGLIKQVKEIFQHNDFTLHYDKTYICIEGPAFSTQAESRMYRLFGADIIGMTNFPEYALAREAGMYYLPLSFVTDYDCWDDSFEPVTFEAVKQVMQHNNDKAFALIERLLPATQNLFTQGCSEQGLKNGLTTPIAQLPQEVQSWLKILCQ